MKIEEKISLFLNESMSRYCGFYKAKDKNWYMDLADNEYDEYNKSTTYGPFNTYEDAKEYLEYFANPGSYYVEKKVRPVPKKSPNGKPVQYPKSQRERLGW